MCEFERHIFFFLEKSSLPNTHSHQHFSIIVCPIGDLPHSTKPSPNLCFNQRTKHHFSHQIVQYKSRLTDRFRCKCNTFFRFCFHICCVTHWTPTINRFTKMHNFIFHSLFPVCFFCCKQRPVTEIFCENEFHLQPLFYAFIRSSKREHLFERKKRQTRKSHRKYFM